jgi:hypothetical protein
MYSASSSPHRVEGEVCFMRHYTPSRHKSDDKEETETETETRQGCHPPRRTAENTKKAINGTEGFGFGRDNNQQTLIKRSSASNEAGWTRNSKL